MSVHHIEVRVSTGGDGEMLDLTGRVVDAVKASGISDGTATVFVPGSTAAVTTIEYEPGLLEDFPQAMERLAPRNASYAHDRAWHDGNGHAHVRASAIGPSLTVPVADGMPLLGTWQQVVLVDFDNRARQRRIVVTVMGE